jgi:predicted nucleic acid-binding protein
VLVLHRITENDENEAWSYFESYQDQVFSFQDCTSFAVAADYDVEYVFGFDRDFQIAGIDLRPGSG